MVFHDMLSKFYKKLLWYLNCRELLRKMSAENFIFVDYKRQIPGMTSLPPTLAAKKFHEDGIFDRQDYYNFSQEYPKFTNFWNPQIPDTHFKHFDDFGQFLPFWKVSKKLLWVLKSVFSSGWASLDVKSSKKIDFEKSQKWPKSKGVNLNLRWLNYSTPIKFPRL